MCNSMLESHARSRGGVLPSPVTVNTRAIIIYIEGPGVALPMLKQLSFHSRALNQPHHIGLPFAWSMSTDMILDRVLERNKGCVTICGPL